MMSFDYDWEAQECGCFACQHFALAIACAVLIPAGFFGGLVWLIS